MGLGTKGDKKIVACSALYFHYVFIFLYYGLFHLICTKVDKQSPMHRFIPWLEDEESSPGTLGGQNESAQPFSIWSNTTGPPFPHPHIQPLASAVQSVHATTCSIWTSLGRISEQQKLYFVP